jgi:hypothetical protein
MRDDQDSAEGWFVGRLEAAGEGKWTAHTPGPPLSPDDFRAYSRALDAVEEDIEQEPINYVHLNGNEWTRFAREIGDEFEDRRSAGEWNPHGQISSELRYKALNWLLSFRAYLDHKQAQLSRRYGKASAELSAFKDVCSTAYDDSFSYRLCYRLRNYAQHVGFPPLQVTIQEVEIEGGLERWAMLELDRDELLRNYKEWGAQVRTDLEAGPAKLLMDEHVVGVRQQLDAIHKRVIVIDDPFLQGQLKVVRDLLGKVPTDRAGAPHLLKLTPQTGKPKLIHFRPIPPLADDGASRLDRRQPNP